MMALLKELGIWLLIIVGVAVFITALGMAASSIYPSAGV